MRLLGSLARRGKDQVGGYEGSGKVMRASCVFHPAIDALLKNTFLSTGEKRITSVVASSLDIVGIAFWFMDNGTLNVGSGEQQPRAFFATQRQDLEEVEILRDRLISLGFDCAINDYSSGYIIGLTKEGSRAFFPTIAPFLHRSMMYKVPEEYRGSSFWDHFEHKEAPLLRDVEVLSIEVGRPYRFNATVNSFVYDLSVTDNNNYFTCGGALVHNSNVGIVTENNRLIHIQNRKNIVDPFQINGGRAYMMEGIFGAVDRGYILKDGVQYGECLGPKLNCNIYKLPTHLWYPFTKARESLKYSSFHKYEKSFTSWSEWFRLYLKSIFYCRYHKLPLSDMFFHPDVPVAEGVVFYNDTISVCDKPRMAKLRVDMYPWHYWDKIHIKGLDAHWLEYAQQHGLQVKGY
jgi:hypothetical protein